MIREEIIQMIKERYEQNHGTIRRRDFSYPEITIILKEFKSFTNAYEAAGVKAYKRKLDNGLAIKTLRDFYELHGFSPNSFTHKYSKELYDRSTYLKVLKCSTWGEVLQKAHLPAYQHKLKNNEYTRENILSLAYDLIGKYNYKTVTALVKSRKFVSVTIINKLFGSEEELSKEIGLSFNKVTQLSDIVKRIRKMYEDTRKIPSFADLKNSGISETSIRKYGHINELLYVALGIERKKYSACDMSNDELLNLYREESLKNGFNNGMPAAKIKIVIGINKDVFMTRFGNIINLRTLSGFDSTVSQSSKYDENKIKNLLRIKTREYGKRLKLSYLKNDEDVPSITTIRRYLTKPFSIVAKDLYSEYMSTEYKNNKDEAKRLAIAGKSTKEIADELKISLIHATRLSSSYRVNRRYPIENSVRQLIISKYENGEKIKDILAETNVSLRTLIRICKSASLRRIISPKVKYKVISYLERGKTAKYIADKLGIKRTRIYYIKASLSAKTGK